MKLGFEETQSPYSSGSQSARLWTERWVKEWLYCPNCGHSPVSQFPANQPVADFFCTACSEEYELKSQKGKFGSRVVDGAFHTMMQRMAALNNPNLFLLNYDLARLSVTNVFVVPKHFSSKKLSRKGNLWPKRLVGLDGLDATFCSIKSRRQVKFSSSKMDR